MAHESPFSRARAGRCQDDRRGKFATRPWLTRKPRFSKTNFSASVRGSGPKDYREADPEKDRAPIQRGIEKPHPVPRERAMSRQHLRTVARKLGVGHFSMAPAGEVPDAAVLTAIPYGPDDHLRGFRVRLEAGHDRTFPEQQAGRSRPVYSTEGDSREHPVPTGKRC